MKSLRKLMALVLAAGMIASSAMPAFASGDVAPAQGQEQEATNPGSITINSPIMGAKYDAYQIFDMTMNDDTNPDSFAYTIKTDSPFYNAVKAYAEETKTVTEGGEEKQVPANGMTLTPSSDGTLYNVTVSDDFDAQKFGKYLEGKINSTGSDKITVPAEKIYHPEYETGKDSVTVAKSDAVTFSELPLGYYLILSEYPDPYNFVYMEYGTEGAEGYKKWEFTKDSTPAEIEAAADEYSKKVYPDEAAAQAYVTANPGNFEKAWADMTAEEKAQVLKDLQDTTKQSAINLINEKIASSIADDNTQPLTERLVFIDSTTPHADINEKNEVEKWDTPVNPEGHADLPDVPDHGEPDGGKNIVVKEGNPAVYADWSEANIGDDVHYQLNINATNFERVEVTEQVKTGTDPETGDDIYETRPVMENGHVKFEVKPIKEYVIADYQNQNMEFNAAKKLIVTIIKKQADGSEVEVSEPMDYTKWVTEKGYFFTNTQNKDLGDGEVFNGTGGIVIPWIEQITEAEAAGKTNVTTNEVFKKGDEVTDGTYDEATMFKVTENGTEKVYKKIPIYVEAKEDTDPAYVETASDGTRYLLVDHPTEKVQEGTNEDGSPKMVPKKVRVQAKDAKGNLLFETEKYYFASKYPNDVTIRVDYYMTLKDTATIDEPGNTNVAQFGVDYLDKEEVSFTPDKPDTPPEEPKEPEEKKDKDDAKVYTYALALHKVDENGLSLAGAKFKIKGLTVTKKADGWYKVKKLTTTGEGFSFDDSYADELVTDKDGNLVIEGLMTSQEVEIMETEAPVGYNKLNETFTANPKKIGETVTTTSKTTYTDKDGITTETSNTEVVYKNATGGQVAKDVTNADGTHTYYGAGASTIGEEDFNAAIAPYTGETETDVNANQLTPVEVKVENRKGAELPATGGQGTRMIYTFGGIMVGLAGLLLIFRRKRA